MNQEPKNNNKWSIACIGAAAIIIAAILSWGVPFAKNIADRIFPPLTPTTNSIAPTQIPIATTLPQPVNQPTIAPSQMTIATALPQPTNQPTIAPTSLPDIIISANANNGVQFTAPISGNYQFTIKEGVYCTPNICRSIIRGYLGRDIVWKDWYGLPHPMEQDYEIGCWENDTESNINCAVGRSLVISMNAQQYIRWVIMEDKNSFADNKGSVVLKVEKLP
jgi:hypothetical protein